jgi:methyltransferase
MSPLVIIVALVALQRLGEVIYAGRNTRALKQRGAVEAGSGHYPAMVALHAGWLAALLLFVPADAPLSWAWLGIFLAMQLLRLWVVASLGRYWTTRIITLPGAPLIRRGPYRFLRHPNYVVVAGEIATLPLAFGAWQIAVVFSLLNALMVAWRIRIENEALAPRRKLA